MTQKENGKYKNKPRGQSLIEFALTLPILLLLILGAVDFGRMFTTKIVITNAAREGASFLSRRVVRADTKTPEGWRLETVTVIQDEGNSSGVTIEAGDIDFHGCCNVIAENDMLTITVTNSIDLIFGNFLETLGLLSQPFEISSTVKMMVQ